MTENTPENTSQPPTDDNGIPSKPPKICFIVPYRSRPEQLNLFKRNQIFLLGHLQKHSAMVVIVNQTGDDTATPFNRGAMKNIGFIWVRNLYPNDYKTISFVFHDVDTLPYNRDLFNYETSPLCIKHLYGLKNSLGGIFSISGEDYERMNGFPNYWGWGMEDTVFLRRLTMLVNAIKYANSTKPPKERMLLPYIDYSQFREVNDPAVLVIFHGFLRNLDVGINERANADDGKTGLNTLSDITCENIELEYIDTEHRVPFIKLNVNGFKTEYDFNGCVFRDVSLIGDGKTEEPKIKPADKLV